MHAIHFKFSIAIVLKTRPKQHIDFLLLDIGPGFTLLAFAIQVWGLQSKVLDVFVPKSSPVKMQLNFEPDHKS